VTTEVLGVEKVPRLHEHVGVLQTWAVGDLVKDQRGLHKVCRGILKSVTLATRVEIYAKESDSLKDAASWLKLRFPACGCHAGNV